MSVSNDAPLFGVVRLTAATLRLQSVQSDSVTVQHLQGRVVLDVSVSGHNRIFDLSREQAAAFAALLVGPTDATSGAAA